MFLRLPCTPGKALFACLLITLTKGWASFCDMQSLPDQVKPVSSAMPSCDSAFQALTSILTTAPSLRVIFPLSRPFFHCTQEHEVSRAIVVMTCSTAVCCDAVFYGAVFFDA
jgi:hypothetical protein